MTRRWRRCGPPVRCHPHPPSGASACAGAYRWSSQAKTWPGDTIRGVNDLPPFRGGSMYARVPLSTAIATLVLFTSGLALAQTGAGEEMPRIRISDPNRDLFKLALPNVVGDAAATEAQEVQRRALEIMGLFNLLNPASFPPDLQREGLGFSSALWSQVGAQGVAKAQVSRDGGGITLQGRLYQVGRGEGPVLEKTYRGPALRPLAHAWV